MCVCVCVNYGWCTTKTSFFYKIQHFNNLEIIITTSTNRTETETESWICKIVLKSYEFTINILVLLLSLSELNLNCLYHIDFEKIGRGETLFVDADEQGDVRNQKE